ncbi:hypothetical protein K438DRAFT_1762960 [Mycena galopus ATCC 62051]|nr:hypothetical protein K438DRAFT_1762960 [Mycena galopus ATCC 62051]
MGGYQLGARENYFVSNEDSVEVGTGAKLQPAIPGLSGVFLLFYRPLAPALLSVISAIFVEVKRVLSSLLPVISKKEDRLPTRLGYPRQTKKWRSWGRMMIFYARISPKNVPDRNREWYARIFQLYSAGARSTLKAAFFLLWILDLSSKWRHGVVVQKGDPIKAIEKPFE